MSERLTIGPGLYRNHLGAEITVERLYGAAWGDSTDTIGGIWLAWQDYSLMGRRVYLVTREGLEESGYQRITGGERDG